MKTEEAEYWLREQLMDVYDARERSTIAAWIMEKVTGLQRVDRLTQREVPLHVDQLHRLTAIVQRMQMHEPVQYVLGETYFHGLRLYVDKNVLIPRPETEELVEWTISDVKASGKAVLPDAPTKADKTRSLKILDVGTGSGCIALALKKSIPKAEVWGCDISEEALNVARRNGAALDVRVDFQQINILDPEQWNSLPLFDIIVSNPPYIAKQEQGTMQPNVVAHEPHTALFVPNENPLLFYETLVHFGIKKLHTGGALYAEIHEDRGNDMLQLFQNVMYTNVQLRKDMQGKDRMVKAVKRS